MHGASRASQRTTGPQQNNDAATPPVISGGKAICISSMVLGAIVYSA